MRKKTMERGDLMYNRIKGYRNMVNETQDDWAKILGITRQAYSQKENGINYFKDSEKLIIKKHLEKKGIRKTIDELFF